MAGRPAGLLGLRDGRRDPGLVRAGLDRLGAGAGGLRLAAVPRHPDLAVLRHGRRPHRQPQPALPDAAHLHRRGAALAALFLADLATPVPVFVLATVMGLVRPSDITLRNLLVGETMPAELLMRAMGVSRTTADSARVVGALSGAGLVAVLGSGLAYVVVCVVYAASLALTLNVGIRRVRVLGEDGIAVAACARCGRASPMSGRRPTCGRDAAGLPDELRRLSVRRLAAGLCRQGHLRPRPDRPGLADRLLRGRRAAGSIALSTHGARIRPARTMIVGAIAVVRAQFRLLLDRRAVLGRGRAVRGRLRPELLHGADGGDPAAHRRSRVSRPGDGRAHAGGLRPAARHAAGGPADRAHRLFADGHALQPGGHRLHPADRRRLARQLWHPAAAANMR